MSLDPHVKGFLNKLGASRRPKSWQLTPIEAREAFLALANAVDAKDISIGRIENGELSGPGGRLAYRIYTPFAAADELLPGLVYFHGGGFVVGSLDTHEGLCRILANESGCRVVSVNYRLAPEHKFPAALDDAYAATKWIAERALELGIDPSRLAVGGDSSGGTLAAVVCQLAKQAGGPKLALQVLFCPPMDAAAETESMRDFAEGFFLEKKGLDAGLNYYRSPDVDLIDPRMSPLRAADVADLPPAHIHTAEFDPLRDEGKAYADRLRRAGVSVRYTCHEGMIHHFYAMANAIPYARIALRDAGAAIREATLAVSRDPKWSAPPSMRP
jgi:acetyl esterase